MEVVTPAQHADGGYPGIPPAVLAHGRTRTDVEDGDQAGFPGGLLPADNNNFAPRIGAAFRMTDSSSVRGGYGIYYWTMPLSQILQSSRTNPPLEPPLRERGLSNSTVRTTTTHSSHVPCAERLSSARPLST